jgi:AcrR family transcriptional regulator
MSQNLETAITTRDRLIDAAISIIEGEGEVAVRVDRVAETAGFTKPVLYHHFADREAVIAAAQAERYRRSLRFGREETADLVNTATTAHDFYVAMKSWVQSFSGPDGEQRRKFRIEVLGSAATRRELLASVNEANRDHVRQLASILRLAQAHGWLRRDVDVTDLAQWWSGVILSRHFAEIDKDHFNMDTWDAITESVLRSMIVGL